MNIFDSIRNIFGFSHNRKPPINFDERALHKEDEDDINVFSRGLFNNDEDARFFEQHNGEGPRSFNIFSNPIEMHKYFEHQMNEMLKNFAFNFGDGNNLFHSFNLPSIDGPSTAETEPFEIPSNGSIRDQYLKSGYEEPKHDEKVDRVMDGSLNKGELDSIFGKHNTQVTPRQNKPNIQFFGQSVTTKTMRRPDGSFETHRTVRDHEGNEETTITKKVGDKEYSVTKRRNKSGEEETIENFVNMDESDVNKMLQTPRNSKTEESQLPPNWFPFDRFFK